MVVRHRSCLGHFPVQNHDLAFGLELTTRKTKQKRHFFLKTRSHSNLIEGGIKYGKVTTMNKCQGAKKAKIIYWPGTSRYCLAAMA